MHTQQQQQQQQQDGRQAGKQAGKSHLLCCALLLVHCQVPPHMIKLRQVLA
jgi:hypothetical protein